MNRSDLKTFRHPKEFSRFLITLLVISPILITLILFVFVTKGLALFFVPIILFGIWFVSRLRIAQFLNNSVMVSQKSFPNIDKHISEAKTIFGYTGAVDAYVYEDGSYNAAIVSLLRRKAILVNSDLLHGSSKEDEIRYIVGRFVGALASKHYRFAWLQAFISSVESIYVFNVFLYPYERAVQLSGDQLGLALVDGNIEVAVRALLKTVVGSDVGDKVDVEGFLDQELITRGSFFSWLARALSAFPHATHRVANLFRFGHEKYPDKTKAYLLTLPESTRSIANISFVRR